MSKIDKEKRTAPLGLRIRPSLKDSLSVLAEADRRPLATYIEMVLEEHVENNKKAVAKAARKSG